MKPHEFDLEHFIMEHVLNSSQWHLPFVHPLALPSYLTMHGLMLIICSVMLISAAVYANTRKQRIPSGFSNFLEASVVYIKDEVVVPFLGEDDGRKMTPLFCTFFFFILGLNLLGLIPLFSTATANINVTGSLALITLFFMIFGAIYKNGLSGFLKAFVPSGVPLPILILLVPLEFAGLFIKSFALMIRLFANMLAGHIAILSLIGLIGLLGYIALPSIILAIFITLLEIFVCFLQAYIFTLLSAMFIGQMYHAQH